MYSIIVQVKEKGSRNKWLDNIHKKSLSHAQSKMILHTTR